MQTPFTVKKAASAISQNRLGDFGLYVNNLHDRALDWLTFLFNQRLETGLTFN